MITVKIIDDFQNSHFVRLFNDNREYASIWGKPEIELSGAEDRWMVTVRDNEGSIKAYLYADLIQKED